MRSCENCEFFRRNIYNWPLDAECIHDIEPTCTNEKKYDFWEWEGNDENDCEEWREGSCYQTP